MGNSASSHDLSSSASETSSNDIEPRHASDDDDPSRGSPVKNVSGGKINNRFVQHVTIQTLGSGSGVVEDASAAYYYKGTMYNFENRTTSVGTTFGIAIGGVSGNAGLNAAAAADVLFSSILKDLNTSALGGQIVGMSRLWPGSGRMMRSYRIRVKVPRIDPKSVMAAVGSPLPSDLGTNSLSSAALSFTIELTCKSFIVRSEKGESPLRKALTEGDAELKKLRAILADPAVHPHILPYVRWIVGPSSSMNPSATMGPVERPLYLLRQHAHASLSDRLASRPFLTLIEKNWITFQLLNALQSLHDAGVCHGHLTTENVLLTSWNWVMISDVGCQHFKPVALPDDDPGLWIHWFEGRGREFGGGNTGVGTQEITVGSGHLGSNGEKRCTLPPERFFTPGLVKDATKTTPTELAYSMDVFSLGCVLIELFLNGERALDLGDLMEYRRQGDASNMPLPLKQKLDKIESSKMRAACRHMLSLDPSSRLSPVDYLDRLSASSSSSITHDARRNPKKPDVKISSHSSTLAPIPECFKTTLYPLLLRLRIEINSPDARIALIACKYGDVIKATVGLKDSWGVMYFSRLIGPTLQLLETSAKTDPSKKSKVGEKNCKPSGDPGFSLNEMLLETEELLRQIDSGFATRGENDNFPALDLSSSPKLLPLLDNIPLSPLNELGPQPATAQLSIVILLQVVFSSVRHVQRTSSKFVALKLMHRIALFSPDDVRLQRIVPFVTSLLQDPEPIIRASGIRVLASVLSTVTSFPPSDAQLFPQYVFKKVAHLITDPSLIVRVAFAENIALLAETSLRFLDVGHSVSLYETVIGRHNRDGNCQDISKGEKTSQMCSSSSTTTMIKSSYDSDLSALHEVVLRWMIHITTDTSDHSSQSKQALLGGLPRLCNFFGAEYSFQILPQILAFLNDRKDWQLRAALCHNLPSVCVAVGRAATEQFVIPCIETALNDDVEQVVSEALKCLSMLISLSLLTRTSLLGTDLSSEKSSHNVPVRSRRRREGIVRKCAPLLLHQSYSVRFCAGCLILQTWRILDHTDAEVFVNILLRPYLRYNPSLGKSTPLSHLFACLEMSLSGGIVEGNDIEMQRRETVTQSQNKNPELDVLVKLARVLLVPNTEHASRMPKWYESFQKYSDLYPDLSLPLFSLGGVSLQSVYGVNITASTNFSDQSFIGTDMISTSIRPEEQSGDVDEDIVVGILSRTEAKIAASACKGEWGSSSVIDGIAPENAIIANKIKALKIPPLSPNLGNLITDSGAFSGFDVNMSMKTSWVPKEDNLIASTTLSSGHSSSVVRMAVSHDYSFFVSASHDGTSKVFELRQMQETGGEIQSSLTYEGHTSQQEFSHHARVNDVSILEKSHSVATAASDGSLHVWKVDMLPSNPNQTPTHKRASSVSGLGTLRRVFHGEGEVLAVSHFNTQSASIITYATQRGNIHSLDLRSTRHPFALSLSPDLGYLTDMQVGDDHNWVVVSTSRGFLSLWDIRFQTMVKLWRHSRNSTIKRIANASVNYSNGGRNINEASRPLIFVGSSNNEASLFDISAGDCLQCYRVLDPSLSFIDQAALPFEHRSVPHLESFDVPSPRSPRRFSLGGALEMSVTKSSNKDFVNALVGSISRDGPSYLIAGSSDRMIRYWDLNSASKCFCLSGLGRGQAPPNFEQINHDGIFQLFLCRHRPLPPARMTESGNVPLRNRQGIARSDNGHSDEILDLKLIESPSFGVLSSSRDGIIKLWN